MRHTLAVGGEPRRFLGRGGQILHRDPVRRQAGEDLLGAVGQDDGAQHVMTVDQPLPGALESLQVDGLPFELQVAMRGDVPEIESAGTADPVGLLDRSQRERQVAFLRLWLEGWEPGLRLSVPLTPQALRGNPRRERRQGGRLEQGAQAELDSQIALDLEQQACGDQGMPAQGEEIVIAPHTIDVQQIPPQRREDLLRGAEGVGILGLPCAPGTGSALRSSLPWG